MQQKWNVFILVAYQEIRDANFNVVVDSLHRIKPQWNIRQTMYRVI